MKSSVKSWATAAGSSSNAIGQYFANVQPADIRFLVSTAPLATIDAAQAIAISSGILRLDLGPDTARCLGEQLIAAADHYEQQMAEIQPA